MQSTRGKRVLGGRHHRRSWFGLAGGIAALDVSVARADWGENWGDMIWGTSSIPVPGLDGWGLLLLTVALFSVALPLIAKRRGARTALVIFVALAIPLTAYASTIAIPNFFVNATVADADEVNANFDILVTESNSQDSRIAVMEAAGADITAVTAGAGLSGGGISGAVSLSHSDTSAAASANNASGTVIQDIILDTYGHLTGLASTNLDTRYVRTTGGTISGTLTVTPEIRSPRYVDSNNTAFFVDPASTSILNDLRASSFLDRDDTAFFIDPASTGTSFNAAGSANFAGTMTAAFANIGSATTGGGGLLDVLGPGGVEGSIVASRTDGDGVLVRFRSGTLTQGTISMTAGIVTYGAFTGAHWGWTDEDLEMGMLVSLTGENLRNEAGSEVVYGITSHHQANTPAVLGAYLSLQSPNSPFGPENPYLVMAAGNGPMWILESEGDVVPGTPLIASGVAGHAMADRSDLPRSHIVARAAEAIEWDRVKDRVVDASGVERRRKRISVLFDPFVIERSPSRLDFARLERKVEWLARERMTELLDKDLRKGDFHSAKR